MLLTITGGCRINALFTTTEKERSTFTMLCLPPLGLVTTAVEGYSFSRPRSFSCILVSSEVSHRIATMVSRHVRAYPPLTCTFRLPGKEGNPTRKPYRTAATHVPYAVLLTSESALHRLDLTTRLTGHSLKRALSCVPVTSPERCHLRRLHHFVTCKVIIDA